MIGMKNKLLRKFVIYIQNCFEMLSRLIQSLWLQVVYIYVIQKNIMN